MVRKSILCIDIGGSRIKYAVLPPESNLKNIKSSKLFNLRTLGWLNSSFIELFSKDNCTSIISQKDLTNYSKIAVCVPSPISKGKYLERKDLVNLGMPKNLESAIQKSSGMPAVTLINDADAWAIGIEKYIKLTKKDVNYPIIVLAFGTGIGVSIIKSSSELYSIEISNAPCKYKNLTKASGKNIFLPSKIHQIIGNPFFRWVSKKRPNWSYDEIRSEFTKRVSAFILDFRKILPEKLNNFGTIVLGGGNSEYVSVSKLKNDIGKNVVTFGDRHLGINPDFIPLLGLSNFQNNITIHKSPW